MANDQTFETALRSATREMLGFDEERIDYNVNLEDSGLDSLQMGNFLLAFEEAAGVQIPEEIVDRMWEATTFGEIVKILRAVWLAANSAG